MKILVETSGGGGAVLVIVAVLLAGHGGDVGGALAVVLIVLAVVVALALGGLVAYLVHRARREAAAPRIRHELADSAPVRQLPVSSPRAIDPPAVRLHPEQLAELAEILRRQQAAE